MGHHLEVSSLVVHMVSLVGRGHLAILVRDPMVGMVALPRHPRVLRRGRAVVACQGVMVGMVGA